MSNILGVKIDNLSGEEILERIEAFLAEPKFHQIATINPELVLAAQKNVNFRDILNKCDLCVADGFGIACAFRKKLDCLKCRMTGVDLAEKILEIAEGRGLGVFLACRKDGLSNYEEVKKALLKKYPRLKIDGQDINFPVIASEVKQSLKSADEIATVATLPRNDVLLCNFGAPEQEFFIESQKNDTIRLGIGVGGTFDFWTGKVKRAPILMRKIGLEWLWRLVQQPRRIGRIWRAVIIFPIRVIFNK